MLSALSYHQKVKDHFRAQSKTWDYFAGASNKEEQLLQFKTELLRNTYKFDPSSEPFIYDKINIIKDKLGLQQLPVTVYQAAHTDELNASIVYLNNEAHIVFSGSIIKLLDDEELLAVLAHELTHIKLFTLQDGHLEVADRIITAIANHHQSEPAYYETARLYRLYTEIFCDRGACMVLGKTGPVISSLVKTSTGLDKVNPENYLKQAEEIFSADNNTKTAGISHPENFIRARAVQYWHEKGDAAEAVINSMIEGMSELDQLDIFRQKELSLLTRKVLQLFLKPNWFRTTMVSSLARQYFPDFSWDDAALIDDALVERISNDHSSIKEYLAYLLLDFALADPSLEEIPPGRALQFAEEIRIVDQFNTILKKELKLSDKKLQQYREKALMAYSRVKENEGEQIYN